MGFSLEGFFERLNEIRNDDSLHIEVKMYLINQEIEWQETYARECGQLPPLEG